MSGWWILAAGIVGEVLIFGLWWCACIAGARADERLEQGFGRYWREGE